MPGATAFPADPAVASLVTGLEPAQREAVLAAEPVVCVLAGAGTGKTRVLTLRVARRLVDESAQRGHVLVCTFSRKAAQELRDRLYGLGVGRDVEAGTFHRAALRLIAQHRRDRGQPAPAVVADRRPLLSDLLGSATPDPGRRRERDLGPSPRGSTSARRPPGRRAEVARLDAEIGWAKARLVPPEGYEEACRRASRRPPRPAADVAELYARYEHARRLRGALDLDDLLWHACDLLGQDAELARAVRWWHRHLFVDEMQDLNEAQYRLLRLLAGDEPDLFVVGDPHQSIYGWNGADPEILRRVTEEYAGTRVVRLETNHRCAPPIVRVAAAALGLEAAAPSVPRGAAPLPTVAALRNDAEEARWVARRAWLAHRPGRSWSSIAVLARTNAQLALIAAALDAERVPHRGAGPELAPASDVREPDDVRGPDDVREPNDVREPDDGTGADDAVTLSTFHRAKGLQWRTVFVVGLSDGFVPVSGARSGPARAEERRLLYVALTRAEEELTCTWAALPGDTTDAEHVTARRPSPWLAGIEQALGELRGLDVEPSPSQASAQLARVRAQLAAGDAAAVGSP